MSIQITILGLGQIGASIGLALEKHKDKIKRVGLDREVNISKRAKKLGAVDDVKINLGAAVRKADIVILAMPADQVRETLEVIAEDLQEDTIIMDTSPMRQAVTDWASDLLPSGRFYIGISPVINPEHLRDTDTGLDAAHADMFERGMMVITAGQHTPEPAIKAATTLTGLLGATPHFADVAEMDGIMAAIQVLPYLSAAALLNATLDQPGWQDARKFANRAYVDGTAVANIVGGGNALRDAAMLNAKNSVRVLDRMISSLQQIRGHLVDGDNEALGTLLDDAWKGRDAWMAQRLSANWIVESDVKMPSNSSMMGQMFGFKPRPKLGEKK